jgi:hypothetical protein
MSVAGTYCQDLSRKLRLLATWPPGSPMTVGRVGRFLGDKVFDPETSLGSYGILVNVEDDPAGSAVLSYTSAGVNEFKIAAGGKVPDLISGVVDAEARLTISFGRENGIVFRASGLRYRTMQDQPQMARKVAYLLKRGEWGRDWHIVTQVVEAESASILISQTSSAEMELALGASAAVGSIELLGAELKPRVVRQKEMSTIVVNEGGLVPLFKAKRVKRTLFGNVKLKAGFGPADIPNIENLDDDDLERELFDEVDVVDKIVGDDA